MDSTYKSGVRLGGWPSHKASESCLRKLQCVYCSEPATILPPELPSACCWNCFKQTLYSSPLVFVMSMNHLANRLNNCVARFKPRITLFDDVIIMQSDSSAKISLPEGQMAAQFWNCSQRTCDWCTPLKYGQITVHTVAWSGGTNPGQVPPACLV